MRLRLDEGLLGLGLRIYGKRFLTCRRETLENTKSAQLGVTGVLATTVTCLDVTLLFSCGVGGCEKT